MSEKYIVHNRTKLYITALTILLAAEICFYKLETINLYLIMTGFGILIGIFMIGLDHLHLLINIKRFPIWLITFWIIYFFNGFFRLQRGTFPWDTALYRPVEILAMYFLFSNIVRDGKIRIVYPFVAAGLFSLGYLLYTEGSLILLGTMRIGNRMSGNANTVGYNFGIISLFVMWWYCNEKKWYKLMLFAIFAVVVFLTGSKKALILLLMAFILLFGYSSDHAGRWLKLGIGFAAIVYIVFNVQLFYDIIGFRVEAMFSTILYGKNSALYSYSTDVRLKMIQEGFQIFLKTPIFGGGYNNFYANTTFRYDYSHNNYIELLCTFGLFGTLIYYSKHFSNLVFLLKKVVKSHRTDKDILFPLSLTIAILLLDWAVVSFSAVCVWYIPVIVSSVLVENQKYGDTLNLHNKKGNGVFNNE
jgi:hypothetical protein